MTSPTSPEFASLLDTGKRIARGETSSAEVTRQALARIAALDPHIHAFSTICTDAALAAAERADREHARGEVRGPLHGVPVAVKDLIFTRDYPTRVGMPLLADWQPDVNATVVTRLCEAGAVLIGKTQMTEGATIAHHPDITPPRNPWNADRCSGFSSSGSGAAVAAGLCYAALGSDTGGSIRIPSAMNGTTGIKPTWGRVSRHGVFALAEFCDTIGPLTRSAADAAAVLGAIAGADANDPTASPIAVPDYLSTVEDGIGGAVFGIDRAVIARFCDTQIAAAVEDAAKALVSLGAEIREVSIPDFDIAAAFPLNIASVADAHRATYPAQADRYSPALRAILEQADALSAADIAAALNAGNALRGAYARLFTGIDMLLVPTWSQPTPKAGETERMMEEDPDAMLDILRFTVPYNISGQPALALPGGVDANGMPIGIQLVGRPFEEEVLFRAGHAFQRATDWHTRHPAL
jgi:amidase